MDPLRVPQELGPAFKAAVKLLERKALLVNELESRLSAQGFPQDEIKRVVQYLRERHVLDDQKAIQTVVDAASGSRAAGKNKLRATLTARGLPEELVEESLAARSDEQEREAARCAARKKLGTSASDPHKDRARLGRFLVARGFDEETVEATLAELFGDE